MSRHPELTGHEPAASGPDTEPITLDPSDWDAMRALGHRMVDDMITYLRDVRTRPVWRPIPEDVRERFRAAAPRAGIGAEQAYREFQRDILPYPYGNIHPRFWGWVNGTGTPLGMLADMLAAGINPNVHGGQSSAVFAEEQVLSWLAELLGYAPDAGGLLVSGGSIANLVGLAVAVNARASFDVARLGLRAAPRPMTLYASTEVHSSVDKAVRLLGLGAEALRKIPVDGAFRIDVAALERTVAEDREAGRLPFCVVGTAGTVNTGAFDDLPALAEIAGREGMWLHVDGAFGALAALAPSLRPLTVGLERADSLAFDLHKWLYVPIEAAAVLIRDREAQRRTFAVHAEYLTPLRGGIPAGGSRFGDNGLQLTRGFKALKVWMSLKAHGADTYGRAIAQNVAQARYLAELVERHAEMELLAPVPLNVVCFRFVCRGVPEAALNRLNEEVLVRLQEGGMAAPSHTVLGGRFALRAAITNHRSRNEDFDLLVREVVRLGREIVQGEGAGRPVRGDPSAQEAVS